MSKSTISALEFFSGIGGFHFSLELACSQIGLLPVVKKSFDINELANKTYFKSFNQHPVNRGIDVLKASELEFKDVDLWMLSPPCQPYTAGGKRLDEQDLRTSGLLNLIRILRELPIDCKPKLLFLENVFNFEVSNSRRYLIEALNELGYHIFEFMVSPVQFGIPNHRKRYYLGAFKKENHIPDSYPMDQSKIIKCPSEFIRNYIVPPLDLLSDYVKIEYMQDPTLIPEYLYVKEKDIRKRTNFYFDVVTPTSSQTSTFTKAYGTHHFFGSGSMLKTRGIDKEYDGDVEELVTSKPRFFDIEEVSKLHHFPISNGSSDYSFPGDKTGTTIGNGDGSIEFQHFLAFPDELSMKQKWSLLGNSLNVKVVGLLLKELIQRYQELE